MIELPLSFAHKPPKDTLMKLKITKGMLFLSGYGITVSILTLTMMLGLFGDSTTPKQQNTMHQSTTKSVEMK